MVKRRPMRLLPFCWVLPGHERDARAAVDGPAFRRVRHRLPGPGHSQVLSPLRGQDRHRLPAQGLGLPSVLCAGVVTTAFALTLLALLNFVFLLTPEGGGAVGLLVERARDLGRGERLMP